MRFKCFCFYALIVLDVAAWSGYIVRTFLLMVCLLEVWEKEVQQTQTLLVKLCKRLSALRKKRCSAVDNSRERAIIDIVGRSPVLLWRVLVNMFYYISLGYDRVFIFGLQNTKCDRLGFLWRLPTKEVKKVAYLLASLAASAAALPLTRRDTLDIAPARKQSTMPWFLRGQ